MDPITLHFNVFKAGNSERRTFVVDDPRGTTVAALKAEVFPEAVQEQRTVRFIACGRVLDDKATIEKCNLSKEVHVHVSISADPSASSSQRPSGSGAGLIGSDNDYEKKAGLFGLTFYFSFAFFVGSGVALRVAYQNRRSFSMHTSQLIFIAAAVWTYLLLCHGLPAFFQVLVDRFGGGGANEAVTARPMRSLSTSSSASVDTDSSPRATGTSVSESSLGGAMAPVLSETHGAARAQSVLSASGFEA